METETGEELVEIYGAREHNLKNIDVVFPRNKLVVITGLSGSGKSSLAFDTIYAEGQRRYMESFSAYARQFLGNMERPDVDQINGLSPVISIEQKTTGSNPRSTVGTITEVYDFMRLLFARAGEAYSYVSGEKMIKLTDEQILKLIVDQFSNHRIHILAPVVKGRKGHYRELFEQIMTMGFLRVRMDGDFLELKRGLQADRYKIHDIEIVVDKLTVSQEVMTRLYDSIKLALKHGKGSMMIYDEDQKTVRHFSQHLMCPTSGISYDEPQPNTFSFNSPYGACPKCSGLGVVPEIDINTVIPNKKLSIKQGGIVPLGEYKDNWIFTQVAAIGKKHGFTLNTKLEEVSDEAINIILYGSDELLSVEREYVPGSVHSYSLTFEGIINFMTNHFNESSSESAKRWIDSFMQQVDCKECNGERLKKESLWIKILDKNII